MNKGGVGGGAGSGPTAAAAAAAAQKQKNLLQRVDADISNIVENFNHMVNVSRVQKKNPNPPIPFSFPSIYSTNLFLGQVSSQGMEFL